MAYLTGFHAIEERIKSERGAEALLVAKAGPRARELVKLAGEHRVRVERTGTFDLDKFAPDNRGIALKVDDNGEGAKSADVNLEDFIAALGDNNSGVLALLLDEITDPHNYGAILRSCDQFGVDLVITRNRRTAAHAEIISRTSAGANAWVPVAEVASLVRAAEDLKEAGFWIYGADMNGTPAYDTDLGGRTALILGSEGEGISRLLRQRCDRMIAIPSTGKIDSLNVSVAAGVLLYEARRQSVTRK
jgi:23S rRNA (guanosine2251-2'-O)-methyltransferase